MTLGESGKVLDFVNCVIPRVTGKFFAGRRSVHSAWCQAAPGRCLIYAFSWSGNLVTQVLAR